MILDSDADDLRSIFQGGISYPIREAECDGYNHQPRQEKILSLYDVSQEYSPEQRLVLAILERAYLDVVQRDKLFYRDTTEKLLTRWLDLDNPRPWGFRWCCEKVGIDPEKMLSRIKRIR